MSIATKLTWLQATVSVVVIIIMLKQVTPVDHIWEQCNPGLRLQTLDESKQRTGESSGHCRSYHAFSVLSLMC